MASHIDPGRTRTPAGPPLPARDQPDGSSRRQHASSARPPRRGDAAGTDDDPARDDTARNDALPAGVGRRPLTAVPAWAISMLVHIVALLAMALIVGDSTPPPRPTIIRSPVSEAEEEFSEFEEQDIPDDIPDEQLDPIADLMVTAEVTVEPVEIASLADDLAAAPLDVELADFGAQTAPASDMMATIGALGGTGGGLGGRGNARQLALGQGGGGDTEAAVDRALDWFALHQLPDGGWSFDFTTCPSCGGQCSNSGTSRKGDRTGATALALLPYLGRGYTHRTRPYQPQIQAGIQFLVQRVIAGKGKAYDAAGNMYSQGLTGIVLSECYALSRDDRLAAPTQAVLNYIMDAQDPRGGGWRYSPGQPGDTSAVGWQLMALKSGSMASLQVNPFTVKKAVQFLDFVQADEYGATYGYLDKSTPGAARSAVGLLCRMYLGWKKDHPGIVEGTRLLAERGPTRDLYYDYYATQVMRHVEGEMWEAWNKKMKSLLLESQSTSGHETGSWSEGFDSGHAAEAAGRLYCTSLATMILEVYYRHLPIYKNQSVEAEFQE